MPIHTASQTRQILKECGTCAAILNWVSGAFAEAITARITHPPHLRTLADALTYGAAHLLCD